jgi:hypothetical protein
VSTGWITQCVIDCCMPSETHANHRCHQACSSFFLTCAPLPEVHPGPSGVLRRFETALLCPRSIQAYLSTTSLRNCAPLPQVHPGLPGYYVASKLRSSTPGPSRPTWVLRRFEPALLYPFRIKPTPFNSSSLNDGLLELHNFVALP